MVAQKERQVVPERVDAATAASLRERNVRIIDVRMPSEFETAHIPGSYNVPLDLLSEHRNELRDAVDQPVILVCASGLRASQAGETLRSSGLESLSILEGGLEAWRRSGYEVREGQQKWSLERQVRGVAGSLVLAGSIAALVYRPAAAFLPAFVGAGLVFAALTNTCTMARLLAKLPYNQGASCDIREVIDQLSNEKAH